jgi:hypothetical protein
MLFPGIECLEPDGHFTCQQCLIDHVRSSSGGRICCPSPGCTREPWSFAILAQHIPEKVFNEIMQVSQQKMVKDRERQLEEEKAALKARHEAALKKNDHALAAALAREQQLQEETSALAVQRDQLAQQQRAWSLPKYWSRLPDAPRRWKLVPAASEELGALAAALTPGAALGGRDQRIRGSHTDFRLGAAWRIENQALFVKYAAEKRGLRESISALEAGRGLVSRSRTPRVQVRDGFARATARLPGELESDINEVYLSHGTKPETVLSVISGGLNERFSGGLFGQGTYFAEDVGKNDQYVTEDTSFGSHPELHKELYPSAAQHPGKVFYIFLCRVTLGHFCRTKDASKNLDTSGSLWASEKRELAPIPGSSPPEPYHGLVAEMGGILQPGGDGRHSYREFVAYHGDRIYPEYLLAYQRV